MSDDLNIDNSNIKFERAHRLNSNILAPIIVKFSHFKNKELVLSKFPQLKKEGRSTGAPTNNQGKRVSGILLQGGIVDTWAILLIEFYLENFTCYDVTRKMSPSAKRNSGGIFVFIRNAQFDIADIKQLFSTKTDIACFRESYPKHSVFVLGDFNAYTSNEPDFIQIDNSFSLLDDISYSEDVTPPIRSNSDLRQTNKYGRNCYSYV
ncbi:hypothetical protein ACF0H5_007051 [Mactra antiquata]